MGFQQISKERNIDIVMCIDATNSMGPCIDNVRNHASKFYRDFVDKMINDYDSQVDSLRLQVVVFRDLECDTEALVKSDFFELPADTALFENYLKGIAPRGGGDIKESGLEALYTAMTTEWEAKRYNDRQVIVLFTDADAIDFGEKSHRTGYPTLCDEQTMKDVWYARMGNRNTMQERCKRLVIFAPANSLYQTKITAQLNRSTFSPVEPKKGMADVSFEDILKIVCASATAL